MSRNQIETNSSACQSEDEGAVNMFIDGKCYQVHIHFKEGEGETMQQKIERLVRREILSRILVEQS